MNRIKQWFLSLRRPIRWLVAAAVLIVLLLSAVTVSATAWEYTNSPEFCGTTCHTMPPEYTAYQVSPHARVDCVDCHLGQESFLLTVPRKAREVRHVINALTQSYEPPIYVKSLRPARDTCEQCHNPDKFSSDTFVELKRYGTDEENALTRTFLIIKTGGGTRREGLGRGIHWHVENEVYFYATDPLKQDIPYVREVYPDGQVVEYFDVEADLPADFGQQVEGELHRMDCIDCHTRISHLFRSPSRAMDQALALQQINSDIPYIKQQGVEVLNQEYGSVNEGMAAVAELSDWYQENYPDFYAENQAAVQDAVEQIQAIFTATVFPNMGVGWQTHPNNAGHQEFPGCFRCHDGKHVSPEEQTIRLECNICHSIPEVVKGEMAAPVLSIEKPGEPESHKDSNWLARHRYEFDDSCAACHDVSNPGGTDNTSFCSNSACHATEWQYVGLDAPAIRAMFAPPKEPGSGQPEPVPHPIGPDTDCSICHELEAVHPFPEDHTGYSVDMCTQCHQPALVEEEIPAIGEEDMEASQVEEAGVTAPRVPHPLEGRAQCLTCHGIDAFKPFPEDHVGRTTETCLACHKSAAPAASEEEAAEEPVIEAESEPETEATPAETATPTKTATPEKTVTPEKTTTPERTTTPEKTATSEKTATPAKTATPEKTVEAEEETPASGPAPIPHTLEGREDCLMCHDLEGMVPFPEDHEGRGVSTCQACHQPAEAEEGEAQAEDAAEATPQRTATPERTATSERRATPTRTVTPARTVEAEEEAPASGPAPIPHTLEGREDCLMCHDLEGMVPFPEDHEGRGVSTCQACHQPEVQ